MGLKWSWAWGPELTATLESAAGWDFSNTAPSQSTPHTGAPELTYAGSPTRYSMNLKSNTSARTPLGVGSPQGWICSHFYLASASGFSGYQIFNIYATSNNRTIHVLAVSDSTLKLYVDGAFKQQTSETFPPQTWHHIAIKYDMTTTTWSGELWMNGSMVASGTDSGVAQTSCHFRINGLRNDTLVNGGYWAGLVHYNSVSDPGSTARYVTRVSPTADVSESGSWSPASGGTAQTTELASPLNTATTVTEPSPASGENLVVNVNNLATQLGITPNIYGVSVHGYADGTGISLEAAVGEGGTYTTGDSVVAGAATYATATAPNKPGGGSWMSGDTVLLKIEVS
jgi:hypothetical protein